MKLKTILGRIVHGLIDGIVTSFGAILGAATTGNSSVVVITGLATAVSCAIADVTSIYSSLEADLLAEYDSLGDMMNVDKDSIKKSWVYLNKRKQLYKLTASDGLATFIGGVLPVSPFLFFPVKTAVPYLIPLTTISLFVLGWLVAKETRENPIALSIKSAIIGLSAFTITYLITKSFPI